MQFRKHEESEFPLKGKSTEKHKYSKVIGFLNILREAEIHTISKRCEKSIRIVRETSRKS